MVTRSNFGSYQQSSVAGERVEAFIPRPFPPYPQLELEGLYSLLEKANLSLGRLDGMSIHLPDQALFLYMYVRKEAVLSSQIEGTQSTLSDLLMYENEERISVPIDDVKEVSNYVAAMEHGLERINEGFPLSMRLIREMHAVLLRSGRGESKQPGAFRHSQNWVGGPRAALATYIPPPWEIVTELLSDLEKFIHETNLNIPTLIKAGMAHLQFESIHPFLDGNGRLGRLLITFILCTEDILKAPLLYLSLYFKTNKMKYYEHLQHARETGDWESWLEFFLTGVIKTANQAFKTIVNIQKTFEKDRTKVLNLGKVSHSVLKVHEHLKNHPITHSKKIQKDCEISLPTVNTSLKELMKLNIVEEITGHARNKIYRYSNYMNIMEEVG